METVKIAIVDDHRIFRKGVVAELSTLKNVQIILEASDGNEFFALLEKEKPEIVFMDIDMPVLNGIETTKKLREHHPEIKVIALTGNGEEEYLQAMLDAGAKGFLTKKIDGTELQNAIENVMKGAGYYSGDIIKTLTSLFLNEKEKKIDFSGREIKVLEYLSQGLTNQQIGEKMSLSHRTIDGYRVSMMNKTGVNNSISLVVYAIKHKLIKPEYQ